jgi:DNA-binding IclR family transcriptional regulator
MPDAPAPAAPEYAAPALDKGLDILELLADQPGGLSQSEIAEAVGRSVGQIFRVLATLERRGYVVRDRQSGLYSFSMKLFDLAHRHPPLRGLIAVATGPMRELADRVQQSCNLSVLDAGRVRVIAQVESPADFGYRVRVGALFDVASTATGSVLTNGEPVVRPDALQPGITDVVVSVRDASGTVAALTVPYVATTFSATPEGDVVAAATATASAISRLLQGEPR